jgi:hypothetical protein
MEEENNMEQTMENGKQPAFAAASEVWHQLGLTKREYFAIHIATGLSVQAIAGRHNIPSEMAQNVPYAAVMIADALMAELAKTELNEKI